MNGRYAVLCPGQGGQHSAMFTMAGDVYAARLSALYGTAVNLILNDSNRLFANRTAQPLVVAAGLGQWAQLRTQVPAPALVAGYSVGELTACGVAGALPAAVLPELADSRAALMDQCVDPLQPQAMFAISGLSQACNAALLHRRGLFPAIFNGGGRLVCAGLLHQCEGLEDEVATLGGQAQRLPLTVASHTPLLASASAGFTLRLDALPWSVFIVPMLSGNSAEKITTPTQARRTLARQLCEPVLWERCMDLLAESSIQVTLELGPGNALSRMLRARHPQIQSRAIEDFRSIGAAAGWLRQQLSAS